MKYTTNGLSIASHVLYCKYEFMLKGYYKLVLIFIVVTYTSYGSKHGRL